LKLPIKPSINFAGPTLAELAPDLRQTVDPGESTAASDDVGSARRARTEAVAATDFVEIIFTSTSLGTADDDAANCHRRGKAHRNKLQNMTRGHLLHHAKRNGVVH